MRKTPFSFFSPRKECLEVDTQGHPGTNALYVRKGTLHFHAASSPSTINTDIPPLKLQRPAATHSPGTDTAGVSGSGLYSDSPEKVSPKRTVAPLLQDHGSSNWSFCHYHFISCKAGLACEKLFNNILNVTHQPSL